MEHFVKKSFGLVLFVVGVISSAFSLLIVTILATEPSIPLALTLVVAAIMCGICFLVTYAGWKLWKGRKQPDVQIHDVQTIDLAAGSPAPKRSGTSKPSGAAKPPGAGASAKSAAPVAIECPGCGAPIRIDPSGPGECEYCGNQIHVGG